jgi:hypothetical protein
MLDDLDFWAWVFLIVGAVVAFLAGIYLLFGFGALWALNVFGFKIPLTWETIVAAAILIFIALMVFKR